MTEYHDPQFDEVVQGIDPHPYGEPAPAAAPASKKTGMNTRGKIALGAAGLAIVGGSIIGYTVHADQAAANQNKAAELAIQQQRLDLERLQITNKLDREQAKEQQAADKDLQAKVDACVQQNRSQSAYLQGVVKACRDQYTATTQVGGDDMQEAASTSSSGGISPGLVIGVGVVGIGVVSLAKFGRRPAPQPATGPHSNCH